MNHIAIVDTRHHTASAPPDLVVAGLSLLERAVRMAEVCGAEQVVLVVPSAEEPPQTGSLAGSLAGSLDGRDLPVATTLDEATDLATATAGPDAIVTTLRSSTVYNRGLYKDAIARLDHRPLAVHTSDGPAHVEVWRGARPDDFETDLDDRWFVDVASPEDARHAADRLWNDCRKDLDGIVARLINRNISIACSRLLASSPIKPNHISIFTFTLGIVAAVLAGWGGWLGFALAGLVFQANSVIDGIDGELARVRYEFSVTGEWLDTLSDDFSDVFFWTGLGIGAWRTYPFDLFGFGPEAWLWLGAISVVFKLASMGLYYTWLVAAGRGDLLAFTWAFDDDDAKEASAVMKVLGNLKYVAKKDFIVFAAMILGFVNLQPWLLVAAAPGNIAVAVGVALQRLAGRGQD